MRLELTPAEQRSRDLAEAIVKAIDARLERDGRQQRESVILELAERLEPLCHPVAPLVFGTEQ